MSPTGFPLFGLGCSTVQLWSKLVLFRECYAPRLVSFYSGPRGISHQSILWKDIAFSKMLRFAVALACERLARHTEVTVVANLNPDTEGVIRSMSFRRVAPFLRGKLVSPNDCSVGKKRLIFSRPK